MAARSWSASKATPSEQSGSTEVQSISRREWRKQQRRTMLRVRFPEMLPRPFSMMTCGYSRSPMRKSEELTQRFRFLNIVPRARFDAVPLDDHLEPEFCRLYAKPITARNAYRSRACIRRVG